MTPSDAESLPEAEWTILVQEWEKWEGHICVNPFPQELS